MIQNIEKTEQLILDFKKWSSPQMASSLFNGVLPVVVQDETSKEKPISIKKPCLSLWRQKF